MLDWVLVVVRIVAGSFCTLLAFFSITEAWKRKDLEMWPYMIGMAVAFASLAVWLFTLQHSFLWGLLAVVVPFLALPFVVFFKVNRQGRKVGHMLEKVRGRPLTAEEDEQQKDLGIQEKMLHAFLEPVDGRQPTQEETVARFQAVQEFFPEVQVPAFAVIQASSTPESPGDVNLEEDDADEEEPEAELRELEAAMVVSPPAVRSCRVDSETPWTIPGNDGLMLPLPSGPVKLEVESAFDELPFEDTEELVFHLSYYELTVRNPDGESVSSTRCTANAVDLASAENALWWESQPAEWKQAFREGTLLGPVLAMEDSRAEVELTISGETVTYYSKYTTFRLTLAIPAGSDRLWCRVHRLTWGDLEADDGIGLIPPFCFPLDAKAFLMQEPEGEE